MEDDTPTHEMGDPEDEADEAKRQTLTTNSGEPVPDNQNSKSAGPEGPLLMEDYHYFEKMAQFNRERIPERVVHAKGGGAFGTFTVTNDEIREYTMADLFSKEGTETDLFVRFSTVAGSKGAPDTVRDPRGFALKFYTEEGELGPCGEQYAGVLHPRSVEVLGLHTHPKGGSRQWAERPHPTVGLLVALA